MKHLLTAIACCLAVAGSAQAPYNPDSDGDNSITVEDLMSTLSFFGGPFFVDYSMIQVCDDLELSSQGVDSCFVEEGKSVVLTNMSPIVLPFDSSFTSVMIVPDNGSQFYRVEWDVYYESWGEWTVDGFNFWNGPITLWVRSRTGYWHRGDIEY